MEQEDEYLKYEDENVVTSADNMEEDGFYKDPDTSSISQILRNPTRLPESKAVLDEVKDDPGNQAQNPFGTSVSMKQGGCDSCGGKNKKGGRKKKKRGGAQLTYDVDDKLTIVDGKVIKEEIKVVERDMSTHDGKCTCGDDCTCCPKKESKMSKVIWFLLKMVVVLILLMVIGAIVLPWIVVLSVKPSIKGVVDQVKKSAKDAVQEVKRDAVNAIDDIRDSLNKASIGSRRLVQQGEDSIEKAYTQVKGWIS